MAPFITAITFLALGSSVLAGNPRFERRAVTGTGSIGTASVGTGLPHPKSTVTAGRYPITNGTIPVAHPTGTGVPHNSPSHTTSVPVELTTPATSLVVSATTSAAMETASHSSSVAAAAAAADAGTQMKDGQVNIGGVTNSPTSQTPHDQASIAGAAAAAAVTKATSATPLVGAGAAAAAATTCPPCPTVIVTSCPVASAMISSHPSTVTITETGPAAVTIKEMVTFTVTASLSGTVFIPTATATGKTLTSVMAGKKTNTVPPYPLVSSFVTVGPTGTGTGTAAVGTAVRAASGAPVASGTGR